MVSWSHCQALDHILSACSSFAHQLSTRHEQVSMAYQRPMNGPFSPYYNPVWSNHPQFYWSSRLNAAVSSSHLGVLLGNNS